MLAKLLGLARTRTPLVSLFSWGSIHAVSPYHVPSLISSDHRRASDTRAATRKHANSSFAGSVVKRVRCEGEKPPHMLETFSSYTSGPAWDGPHGGTSKNARYLLTRLPGPPRHRRLLPQASEASIVSSLIIARFRQGGIQRTTTGQGMHNELTGLTIAANTAAHESKEEDLCCVGSSAVSW